MLDREAANNSDFIKLKCFVDVKCLQGYKAQSPLQMESFCRAWSRGAASER